MGRQMEVGGPGRPSWRADDVTPTVMPHVTLQSTAHACKSVSLLPSDSWEGSFHEEGNPAGLSSCSGGLRPLVELCVEPAGLCVSKKALLVPLPQ